MRSGSKTRQSAARTSPKSKHIHKFSQRKLFSRAPQTRMQREEVPIYYDSSEEKPHREGCLKKECEQGLQATLKIQSLEEASSSEWMEGECSDSHVASIVPSGKSSLGEKPIIAARSFKRVSQLDFELYCTFLLRTKIYGAMLMNHSGRLLWCDKTSHELLEGSLNNFQRIHITELLLNSQLPSFLQHLESIEDFDEQTILQWLVYSKNTKRRYKNVPLPKQPSGADVFYRFLKALTVRIRPISIELPNYRDPNGFCNQKLFAKGEVKNCFLVQLRLTRRPPDLTTIDFINDPVIKKFMKKTRVEQVQRKKQQKRQIKEEEEDGGKLFGEKLKTFNGAQDYAEIMEDEKQRPIVGTAFEKEGKIEKLSQRL